MTYRREQKPEVKVGLTMREKQAVAKEVRGRYRRASKKEKTVILNEFIKTAGYTNRKYAIRILGKREVTEVLTVVNGKPVKCKPVKQERPKNRKGKRIYTDEVIGCLRKLWAFYWYKCGKYLAPVIREQMPFLETHRKPNFHITPLIKEKLLAISPSAIDRSLKADREALRGKGFSGTKLGEAALALSSLLPFPLLELHPDNGGEFIILRQSLKNNWLGAAHFSIRSIYNMLSILLSESCSRLTRLKLLFLNEAPDFFGYFFP
jgi:hypothetical protein